MTAKRIYYAGSTLLALILILAVSGITAAIVFTTFFKVTAIKPDPKKIVPPEAPKTLSEVKKPLPIANPYTISYYTLFYQGNNLISSSGIGNYKQTLAETVIKRMGFSPNFINKITIIVSARSKNYTDVVTLRLLNQDLKVLPLQPLRGNSADQVGTVVNGVAKYILLDDSLVSDDFSSTLAHELGHLISDTLTPDEFREFMKVRKMDQAMIDSWYPYEQAEKARKQSLMPINYIPWEKNAEEDFAECIKSLFGSSNPSNNWWSIRTVYGPLTSEQSTWIKSVIGPKFQNN